MPYAIIQNGYAIFGVGETKDETYANAREWTDDLPEEVPTSTNTIGDFFIVDATQRLVDAVNEKGGQIPYVVKGNVADLDEE